MTVVVPNGTALVTYAVKVVDPAGRTLTATGSAAPVNLCPFG